MVLGIDTSCYTTSAAVENDGKIIADERIILDVKKGNRGLRQSEAVFMHMKNIPEIIEKMKPYMEKVTSVCVSVKPRRQEESYMPVFTAGVSFARIVAASLNIPLNMTTHQEGHIEAALHGSGFKPAGSFITVHISGGTTEILLCCADSFGYDIKIIGKTLDIPAGQLVDRIGVAGGLKFPCGREMDMLAENGGVRLPVTVKGCNIHFTGAETAAIRGLKINGGENSAEHTFAAVFECIGVSLKKALKAACSEYGGRHIVMAGGVAGNSRIRSILTDEFEEKIHFAPPVFSCDNAAGTALIGRKRFERNV